VAEAARPPGLTATARPPRLVWEARWSGLRGRLDASGWLAAPGFPPSPDVTQYPRWWAGETPHPADVTQNPPGPDRKASWWCLAGAPLVWPLAATWLLQRYLTLRPSPAGRVPWLSPWKQRPGPVRPALFRPALFRPGRWAAQPVLGARSGPEAAGQPPPQDGTTAPTHLHEAQRRPWLGLVWRRPRRGVLRPRPWPDVVQRPARRHAAHRWPCSRAAQRKRR
jgi:hypothetical protein